MITSIPGDCVVNSAHIVNKTIQLADKAARELLTLPSRAVSDFAGQESEPYGIYRQPITGS
jgi:hypothetical protein